MSLNQFSYNCLRLQVEKTHYPSSPAVKNMGLCCISICNTAEALALFELWPGGCRFNCPHSSSCFKIKPSFTTIAFSELSLEVSDLVPSNLKSLTKRGFSCSIPASQECLVCVYTSSWISPWNLTSKAVEKDQKAPENGAKPWSLLKTGVSCSNCVVKLLSRRVTKWRREMLKSTNHDLLRKFVLLVYKSHLPL